MSTDARPVETTSVHQFPGSGQRPTPIATTSTLVRFGLSPAKESASGCITLLLRPNFVGDEALHAVHAEIRRNRTQLTGEVGGGFPGSTNDLQDAIPVDQVVANDQTVIQDIEPTQAQARYHRIHPKTYREPARTTPS
jgi:hypothetical protein